MSGTYGSGRHTLDLSRKEMDSLPRNSRIEKTISDCANLMSLGANTAAFDRAVKTAISLCGRTLVAMMSEDDEPALFLPVYLSLNAGGDQLGVIVMLKNRAVIAWTEGKLKLRYFGRSILYTSVRSAEQRPPGNYFASIRVESDDTWVFNLRPMFSDGMSAPLALVEIFSDRGKEKYWD